LRLQAFDEQGAPLPISSYQKDEVFSFLLKQQKAVDTHTIWVSGKQSLEVVHRLLQAKRVLWKGRSLFYNPLLEAKAHLQAEVRQEGIFLSGGVEIGGIYYPSSSIDFLFEGTPLWGICKQIIFVLREVKKSGMLGIYPGDVLLTGAEKSKFLAYKEHPPDGFPEISWKGTCTLQAWPVLVLQDVHGAFANLWMDYGDRLVDMTEEGSFPGRNYEMERGWERDLLETGYQKKLTGSSHYYCPTDQVGKTMAFLWDLGWKIKDSKGRDIIRLSGKNLELSLQKERVIVRGTLQFDSYQADIKDFVGAFSRRETFVELTSEVVGWLGDKEFPSLMQDSDECFISKKSFGLLQAFTEEPGVHLDEPMRSLYERLQMIQESSPEEKPFSKELYPYQQRGRDWLIYLANNGFSGLLADEMGLGKTIQTLAFLSCRDFPDPVLVVVPASLLFQWKKEWEELLPSLPLYVHAGRERKNQEFLQECRAILISYTTLRLDQELFQSLRLSLVILDEAQGIKNPGSQLARVIGSLHSSMRLALTGTPVENRIEDLWSIFRFLEPELLGEKKDFQAAYQAAAADERYIVNIRKKLRPFLLRRGKEEIADQLPDKIEQTIFVEMSEEQREFYEQWLRKAKAGVLHKVYEEGGKARRMEILEAILRLRQIAVDPLLVDGEWQGSSAKKDRVLADLEEMITQGRKVLIYSQFTSMLAILRKEIQKLGWKYVYLDGETKNREEVVSAFQTDPSSQLLLISLKAGGVGLNLTAADYVLLLDPWWNEAVERQAMDRAHRIGRKNPVVARRYITSSSVEEKMMKIKEHKTGLAKGLLEDMQEATAWSFQELCDLLS